MSVAHQDGGETLLLVDVPLRVASLSIAYAAVLGVLERKFPTIRPDHIWAEVAGGVLISLVPVALEARRQTAHGAQVNWQTYEGAVWRAFFASGTPIILWQLGESIVRHRELMQYTTTEVGRSGDIDANDTPTLADGGRARTGGDSDDLAPGDRLSPDSPDED
jgi:hypothetical protein